MFGGFQRFSENFQRPSQSAIFLSELRVVLPLIVLPLKTPTNFRNGQRTVGGPKWTKMDLFSWDSPDLRQGRESPFPGKEGFGVQKPPFLFGPRNPLFQEMGIRGPVWGWGNPNSSSQSGPKWTILIHFGLVNVEIQFGIRGF